MFDLKNWTFWPQFNRLALVVAMLSVFGIVVLKNNSWVTVGQLIWFASFAIFPKVPDTVAVYQRPRYLKLVRYGSVIMLLVWLYTFFK
ncbi:hypothetical protein ABPS01_06390 [Streptococcus sp. ZJ151]|uniref:hypothetical protein n=1 Tax=Streptococcus jiangjianxini TaxID=3161189 RepID=UPI0032EC6941